MAMELRCLDFLVVMLLSVHGGVAGVRARRERRRGARRRRPDSAARSVMKRAANLWIHAERSHTGFSQAALEQALALSEELKAEHLGSDSEQLTPKQKERKKRVRKKASSDHEEEL